MGSNCYDNPYEATYEPNQKYNEAANQQMMAYQDQGMSRQLQMIVTPNKVQVKVKENTQMFIESDQGDYGLQRVQNSVKISQTQSQNSYNGQVYDKYKITYKQRFS